MDKKQEILNGGLRADLSRALPVLSKLEAFKGFSNFQLTYVNSDASRMQVGYEAEATSDVYRALKKSLIEANILTRAAPPTQTYGPISGQKYMRIYFFREGIDVELRVSRATGLSRILNREEIKAVEEADKKRTPSPSEI